MLEAAKSLPIDLSITRSTDGCLGHNVPGCEGGCDDADDVHNPEVPKGGQQGCEHHQAAKDQCVCPANDGIGSLNGPPHMDNL